MTLRFLAAGPPDAHQVLLFLHGKMEASETDLDLVCKHGSPPQQARDGRFPSTRVLAPQAPPRPNLQQWNWQSHVEELAATLAPYRGRLVGTGFSRGGRGILQLVAHAPDLFTRWAVVDPASVSVEVMGALDVANGWAAFGSYEPDPVEHPEANRLWRQGRADLKARLPADRFLETDDDHVALARAIYGGAQPGHYAWLGVAIT